tara:strand:+ start:42 stop:440 length:399 start_codon:yes stop_codon:yes gene_type:complete
MSEIKTDKLTGVGTAGVILVTGEGNSTTTNLQQGLTKVWANLQGSDASIRDSLNVSSSTDVGTGRETITFSNNMGNDDYSGQMSSTGTGSPALFFSRIRVLSTSQFGDDAVNSGGAYTDAGIICYSINGDLA